MTDPAPAPADLVVCGADVLVAPGELRAASDVVIAGGRIVAVEPAPSPARASALVTLDGAGRLAMPGLVNAHTHSPENPLRGKADGLTLEPWLARLFAESGPYGPDDHYACALAGALEMLRCGTTAVVDHLWMTPPSSEAIDATMRALRDIGIRGAVAPLVTDVDATADLARSLGVDLPGPTLVPQVAPPMAADELIAITDAAMARWHGAEDGRLRLLAGPSGVQWCSDELIAGLATVARAHGSGLQIHLVETRLQDAACRARFGRSGAFALDELGALDASTSLAHCVWVDEDDIALIAARGASVAHNPAANLRLGSGRAPIPALLAAGVPVGVGTDGAASSDDQSTWIAMRLAALVHRVPGSWVSGPQALQMATTAGGRVLGEPGLGTLAPGAPADLALLDLGGEGLAGAAELETALVLSETGRGVCDVVVAGEVVLRDGRSTKVDEAVVRDALAAQARKRHVDGPSPETLEAIARIERTRAALEARTPVA